MEEVSLSSFWGKGSKEIKNFNTQALTASNQQKDRNLVLILPNSIFFSLPLSCLMGLMTNIYQNLVKMVNSTLLIPLVQ